MKVVKIDREKNSYRVVQRFAYLPVRRYIHGDGHRIIFLKKYYELQLDSFWGYGWIRESCSFFKNTWDYKWDDRYLQSCGYGKTWVDARCYRNNIQTQVMLNSL